MALENARLYQDARELADRDQLTGFYNHRYLHQRLGEEIVRAQRAPLAAGDPDDRPRRLQAGQRHVRPPLRRPGPGLDRGADPGDPPGERHRGPLRRRRVRGHPARHGPGRRRPRRRPDRGRVPRPRRSRARTAGRSRSVPRSGSPRSRPTAGPAASSSPWPTARCTGSRWRPATRPSGRSIRPTRARPGATASRWAPPPTDRVLGRSTFVPSAGNRRRYHRRGLDERVFARASSRRGVARAPQPRSGRVRTQRSQASDDLATPRRLVRPPGRRRDAGPGRGTGPASSTSSSSSSSG